MTESPLWLIELRAELSEAGLGLCDIIDVDRLDDATWMVPTAERPASGSLLLVGNAGAGLWRSLPEENSGSVQRLDPSTDPVDSFSHRITDKALNRHLPDVERMSLYPFGRCPADLVALGSVLGWHTPSPMGLGIHQSFGMWTAYRALWWLNTSAVGPTVGASTALVDRNRPGPCDSCATTDCVEACPPQALERGRRIDLDACIGHRTKAGSSCAQRCLAREACPVGSHHRYNDDQIAYHYSISLQSMLRNIGGV